MVEKASTEVVEYAIAAIIKIDWQAFIILAVVFDSEEEACSLLDSSLGHALEVIGCDTILNSDGSRKMRH